MLRDDAAPRSVQTKIGRELKVAYVLQGSVQRSAGRIHVNVQLIDTRNASNVWAQDYDRDINDVFTLQSEIVQAVASQLGTNISSSEDAAIRKLASTDLMAYGAYLEAKQLIDSASVSARPNAGLSRAVQLLDLAVARDALFSDAQCKLMEAHDRMSFLDFDRTDPPLQPAKTPLEPIRRPQAASREMHWDKPKPELAIAQRVAQ